MDDALAVCMSVCMYVCMVGVGQTVRQCTFRYGPHASIRYEGNEHLIELNDISYVCMHASDVGAIYSGRHWDYRGIWIKHNYIVCSVCVSALYIVCSVCVCVSALYIVCSVCVCVSALYIVCSVCVCMYSCLVYCM